MSRAVRSALAFCIVALALGRTPAASPQPPGQPSSGTVAIAKPGQPIVNTAIELRVTSHRTAASIAGQTAEAGREFVVVDTAWKNILPQQKVNRKKATDRTAGAGALGFGGGRTTQDQAADDANTTLESVKFEASPLSKFLWLVVDGRAEPLDVQATRGLEARVGPELISIPTFQQVVSGAVAFRAPAGAKSLSLLFLDASHGHLLVPIVGAAPTPTNTLGAGGRTNQFFELALAGAAWSTAPASQAGLRAYVVNVRGISRQNAIVDVPFGDFGFLQMDNGCMAQPDPRAAGLARPLAPMGRFPPFVPNEGQLAFNLPDGANPIAFLLRVQQGGPIDLPLKADAKPRWPAPEATITDGDVLRALKLPGTTVPPGLGAAPAGSERVALDLVVENLRAGAGIEVQAAQQFRLVTPDEKRFAPAADSAKVPCALTGRGVVPAGGARRFTLVYDVPAGQPLQLEYRGFTVKSQLVKVR